MVNRQLQQSWQAQPTYLAWQLQHCIKPECREICTLLQMSSKSLSKLVQQSFWGAHTCVSLRSSDHLDVNIITEDAAPAAKCTQ